VSPEEAFDLICDPGRFEHCRTKTMGITRLATTEDGMVACCDIRYLDHVPTSAVTRWHLSPPARVDIVLEHGFPHYLHATWELAPVPSGTRLSYREEIGLGHGLVGRLHDRAAGAWFDRAVATEVTELARLLVSGVRAGDRRAATVAA
jgi:ribosome-associated toxin RatA of RatAB toxin-antitoxin module